jgi:hypothetical protein
MDCVLRKHSFLSMSPNHTKVKSVVNCVINDYFFTSDNPSFLSAQPSRIYSSLPLCWSLVSSLWCMPTNLGVKAFLDHGYIWLLFSSGILYKIPELGLEIDLENPINSQALDNIQAEFIDWKKYGLSIVLLFTFPGVSFVSMCVCECKFIILLTLEWK